MAWYDDIVKQISAIPDKAGDLIGEYIGSEADKATEKVRNELPQPKVRKPQTAARTHQEAGFNWQMAGVIVGSAGVLLTIYKLVK